MFRITFTRITNEGVFMCSLLDPKWLTLLFYAKAYGRMYIHVDYRPRFSVRLFV